MSRSYKKHPYVTDGGTPGTKNSKKFANKAVRNHKNVPSGGSYKKVFEPWDIRDYKWYESWPEAKKDWEDNKEYYLKHGITLKIAYRHWMAHVKGK